MTKSWDRKRISDDELKQRVKAAIDEGASLNKFYYDLLANNIAIGRPRLAKFWTEFEGNIQENRRWF